MNTKHQSSKGIEHHIKGLFLKVIGNRKETERTASKLKNNCNIGVVSAALNELFQSNANFERLIHGYLSPSEVTDLGRCNGYYFEPESLYSEAQWQIMQIKRHKKKLQLFLCTRTKVEHLFLLGEYEAALNLLESSVQILGYSVWYFEFKILIYSYLDKISDLVNWLSELNSSYRNAKTGYIPFLLSYLYKRSLKSMSPIEYEMELYSKFKRNVTPFDEDKFNYFLFRLNFYESYKIFSDYSKTLLFESPNSAIDRYRNLVNVLRADFVSNPHNRDIVCNLALKLYRASEDENLFLFLAYNQNKLPNKYYDSKFIEILDSYYIGDYESVIVKAKSYAQSNASNFDVLKIYCRALLFLGRSFQNIVKKPNAPLNTIGSHMLKIMQGINVRYNQEELSKLCKNFYGLSICAGLDNYVKEERTGVKDNEMNLISLYIFDPYFVYLLQDEQKKNDYLSLGLSHIPDSIVINYQKGRIENIIAEDSPVVPYIREVDKGKILFKRNEYDACIDIMEKVIVHHKQCVPVVQSAIDFVFNSYINLNKDDKAISYFVDKYIQNHSYTSKIDSTEFIFKLKRKKYKGIRYNLQFLIFVFEKAKEETDKSYVLEKYLRYKQTKDVVGLFEQLKLENNFLVEEFLIHIIQDDILRHTTFIDSTKSILDQEHLILRYLIDLNTINMPLYENLLQNLTEEMIAYDGAIKDDESKIFANIPSIIKYELTSARRLYTQFQALYQTEGVIICMVDNTKPIEPSQQKDDYAYLGQHIHFTDNALKEISFQLFNEIRQQFLKSKFGLGTYLSTRIRHGVFEGELRSIFSGNGIALNMENEVYQPNFYWKTHYRLNDIFNQELMRSLEQFSRRIDAIIKDFKSSVLQIKLNNQDSGLFDYIIDEDAICLCTIASYRKSSDFESFSQNIINYLLEVTERSLSQIRLKIKSDLTSSCLSLLDSLEADVKGSGNINFDTDFKKIINDSRTSITQKLLKIEGWFHFQDLKFEDYDFDQLTSLCWEITTKMHPNVNCKLNVSNPKGLKLTGNTRIHISDLIRIFFSNMIKYSAKEHCRTFVMNTILVDDLLQIVFSNKISENPEKLNEKISRILQNSDRLQKENGSGLIKAQKIVQYDLNNTTNSVSVLAEGDHCVSKIVINLKGLRK